MRQPSKKYKFNKSKIKNKHKLMNCKKLINYCNNNMSHKN